jgi:hypothetical protein
MKVRKILIPAAATLAALGVLPLTASADTAAADNGATVTAPIGIQANTSVFEVVYQGRHAGYGAFSADPGGDFNGDGAADPGDAIIAIDDTADGFGVETRLSTGRIATTRGHDSPYTSPWKTGDLPEGNTYTVRVCVVKSTFEACSSAFAVTS